MIYAPIPSKYLNNDLKEILKNLNTLIIVRYQISNIRNQYSEDLLECENDGEAYEIGQVINNLSTTIKCISDNLSIFTEIICEEEHITLEECINRTKKLTVEELVEDEDEIVEMSNEIASVLMNKISKRYSECKFFHTICNADGTCNDY